MSLAEELLADLDAAPDEDVRPGNSILDSQDGSVSTPVDVRSVRYIARLRDSNKVSLNTLLTVDPEFYYKVFFLSSLFH